MTPFPLLMSGQNCTLGIFVKNCGITGLCAPCLLSLCALAIDRTDPSSRQMGKALAYPQGGWEMDGLIATQNTQNLMTFTFPFSLFALIVSQRKGGNHYRQYCTSNSLGPMQNIDVYSPPSRKTKTSSDIYNLDTHVQGSSKANTS